MIEVQINYNGVEVKIKGEPEGVVSVAAALNEVVNSVKAAATSIKKK